MKHPEAGEIIPLSETLSFKGKSVLVTGASSGIGRAISVRFAEAGASLMLLDINESGLTDTLNRVKYNPTPHNIYPIDLSVKDQIDGLWENDQAPDILINNVGIYPEQNFLSLTRGDLAKTLAINMESALWMCQNFIKLRGKSGGVIVNISSIEAVLPFKRDLVPYGISKAGILALTRSLARDYGREGFRVNAVLPGAIKTEGTKSLIIKALKNFRFDLVKTGISFNQRLALGRWGNPDEIAKVVIFLSSDLASYVQGGVIPVDGGFLSS